MGEGGVEMNGGGEPVLKHGPNTACGGNARERACVSPGLRTFSTCRARAAANEKSPRTAARGLSYVSSNSLAPAGETHYGATFDSSSTVRWLYGVAFVQGPV